MAIPRPEAVCPCGSGAVYAACCRPYCEEERRPASAEILMRSRYTAFVVGNSPYLLKTWHPETRPAGLSVEEYQGIEWRGLEILAVDKGLEGETRGTVEFVARFEAHGRPHRLHEKSRFVFEENQWFYLDGEVQRQKIGRNALCPCGSGKKQKRCCLME